MDQAIVIRPRFAPGRRIIAVSDVHGNLDFFRGLMDRVGLTSWCWWETCWRRDRTASRFCGM